MSIENILKISNYWLFISCKKYNFRQKVYESYNGSKEKCRIVVKSKFRTEYFVEIKKNNGKILSKNVKNTKDLYNFLQKEGY